MVNEQYGAMPPKGPTKVCRKCNSEQAADQTFCSNCGEPLSGAMKQTGTRPASSGLGMLGQIAVLLAMLFYGFAAIYTRLKARGIPQIIQALVPLIVADALVWLIVPFTEMPFQLPQQVDTWGAILFLAIVSSCLAYLMYYYLLHAIGPTRTTFITYMFPLVGVISGAAFLGERIDLRMIAGGALVLFSVLIVNDTLGGLWRRWRNLGQPG